MAELTFEDIEFKQMNGKVKVRFLNNYITYIDDDELQKIGDYSVENHNITFASPQDRAEKRFNQLLGSAFTNLKHAVQRRKAVYIHRYSGIPIIGNLAFGIVDKGSWMLELKPVTGCNIGCIFCSVDEGIGSKRKVDYIVEREYIVDETRKLIGFKKKRHNEEDEFFIDIYLNTQGEPMLYSQMDKLIADLRSIDGVRIISMMTNGTLLTNDLIDKLISAGISQFNISINAYEQNKARELAGTQNFNIKHVLDMARYAGERVEVVVAPVWLKGINDEEIPKLIEFTKTIPKARIFPQNFLINKTGRNPIKEQSFEWFNDVLGSLAREHGVDMTLPDFKPLKTAEYSVPFRKGDVVKAEVLAPGRSRNERLCVAGERVITVYKCNQDSGWVKVKILHSLHNIFSGMAV